MRKRNATHVIKTLFWYFIYAFPLILFVGWSFRLYSNAEILADWFAYDGADWSTIFNLLNFSEFMSSFVSYGLIYDTLFELFADGGIVFLFDGYNAYGLLAYLAYFVSVYIIHLCIDFLLFIPRLCHKWMSDFTGSDEGE